MRSKDFHNEHGYMERAESAVDVIAYRKQILAEQLFYNNFDCYANLEKSGFKINEDIPAMTKDMFVKIVVNLL